MKNLDIVIPHKSGDAFRSRNLLLTLRYYRDALPESAITVAEQDSDTDLSGFPGVRHLRTTSETGLFDRGRVLNGGVASGDGEWILLVDNDSLVNTHVLRSLPDLLAGKFALFPYNEIRYLREQETAALQDPCRVDPSMGKTRWSGKNFPGLALFVRRKEFESVGGYEEFEGWGCEDSVLNHKLRILCGPLPRVPGREPIYHLWHPIAYTREWIRSGQFQRNAERSERIQKMGREQLEEYIAQSREEPRGDS